MSHYDCERCGRYPTDCDCSWRDEASKTERSKAILDCIDVVERFNEPQSSSNFHALLKWTPAEHLELRKKALVEKLKKMIKEIDNG